MSVLMKFRDKWCYPDSKAKSVTNAEFEAAEFKLGFVFPSGYKVEVVSAGALDVSLGLLSAIVEQQINLHDLSELYTPAEIVACTEGGRAIGMPANLVAIGSDCMGNSFCFDTQQRPIFWRKELAIVFWDHDFNTTKKVASSFTTWIKGYLRVRGTFDN